MPALEAEAPDIVALATGALETLSENEWLFTQGNRIVEIDCDGDKITVDGVKRQRLIYHLRRLFDWEQKVLAPVATDIMQHRSFPNFRRLEATYTAPTLREDFTLISPGYDNKSASFYHQPRKLKSHAFNQKATQADAKKAYQKLLYPFTDFPFVTESDRINIIAFLLTLVGRTALDTIIPVLAIDANGQSAGKTLVTETIYRMAFDGKLSSFSVPSSKKEWETRMDSLLMSSEKVACVDNIIGRFQSDVFASLVTAKRRKVRLLGQGKLHDVKNEMAFVLNGNNIKVDTDMAERIIWVNLWHPDPSSRKQDFKVNREQGTDLATHLEAHQLEYFDAAMTVILAWRNAGMPERKQAVLNKYGEWEHKIGGMLEFVGASEFLRNHSEKAEHADDEKQEIIRFIDAVVKHFPKAMTTGVTMMEMAELMKPEGEWKGMLPGVSGGSVQGLSGSLGKFLSSKVAMPFGQYKMYKKDLRSGMALIVRIAR